MFIIFYLLIVLINADLNIVRQSPKGTIYPDTHQFFFEINQTINQPSFSTFIHICNATTNVTILQIDAQNNATYLNNTLSFYIPDTIKWNINDEFFITFDAGVLFSNSTFNSTAENDFNFWLLKVIDFESTTSMTSVFPMTTSMESTHTAMTSSATNTFIMTTYTATIQNSTTTIFTTVKPSGGGGQSPSTRSAQLGMGLGITFITLLIIGEIIYFKFCYTSQGRSASYFT